MKKEFVKIIVALIVLFGIAIPLSLHRGKKMKEEIAKDESQKFVTFSLDTIEKIQVVNKAGVQVELEKREKGADGKFQDEFENRTFEFRTPPQWIVVQPYRSLADDNKINAFKDQLAQLSYLKVIQDNQEKKAEYSLDKPSFVARFFEAKQSEPKLSLYVGGDNPGSTGSYFSASDKPGIYLGDRALQAYSDQDEDQWRERRILDTPDLGNVESVAFTYPSTPKDSFKAVREKGVWSIASNPKPIHADQGLLNGFMEHLNGMRFMKSFANTNVIGKNKLLSMIDWKLKDRDPIRISIFDGGKNSEIYYLQRSDLKEIFQIAAPDPKLMNTFQKTVDKHLLSASDDEIVSMKVTYAAGNSVELAKENEFWKIQKPYVDVGSEKRIQSIAQVLRDFQGEEYIPTKTFSPNNLKLKFDYGLKDQKTFSISFYQEGKTTFASIDDTTTTRNLLIGHIPPEIYDHLSHLRSDDLISVPNERLKSMAIARGDAKIEIQKNANSDVWAVMSIENVPSTVNMKWREQMTAQEMANRASEMFVTKFVPEKSPDDPYKELELTITATDGKSTHWNFGKKTGEMVNIFSPERNVAGQIPWIKYKELSEFLNEPEKTAK